MRKSSKRKKAKFNTAEQEEFKRFSKAARTVGLLVSKGSYIRYFRGSADTTNKE